MAVMFVYILIYFSFVFLTRKYILFVSSPSLSMVPLSHTVNYFRYFFFWNLFHSFFNLPQLAFPIIL
jgi:hypothetical protein